MARLIRVLALLLCPCAAWAQDSAGSSDDIKAIRQTLEQQSRQLDVMAQEIARLNLLLEGKNSSSIPPVETPGPVTGQRQPAPPSAQAEAPAAPLPSAVPGGPVHVITRGETLTAIAKRYKVTVAQLLKVNKIADARKLQIGQTLVLPPGAKIPQSPVPTP